MIQVEMAGQRRPPVIELIPDHVRAVAMELIETCSREQGYVVGGFTYGSLYNMISWLSSPGGEIDKPMRESTPPTPLSTPPRNTISTYPRRPLPIPANSI